MQKKRITRLNYLKKITDSDPVRMKELIRLFLEQSVEYRNGLKNALLQEQWNNLGRLAHKARSSVLVFGMQELGVLLKFLQQYTKDPVDVTACTWAVGEFEQTILQAEQELQDELKKLS
ncbi:MAG: Hpt domain-containing protein [Mangrovibacterium sp.]